MRHQEDLPNVIQKSRRHLLSTLKHTERASVAFATAALLQMNPSDMSLLFMNQKLKLCILFHHTVQFGYVRLPLVEYFTSRTDMHGPGRLVLMLYQCLCIPMDHLYFIINV